MPQPRHHVDAAARQRAYRTRQAQARVDEHAAKGLPSAPALATLPSRARWHALLDHARAALVTTCDELDAYADARSAAWQESERASTLQDYRDAIAQALDAIAQALDALDSVPPL